MSAAFRQSEPISLVRQREGGAVIRVVGVGGAGCNAVARMVEEGISGVEFLVANTDAQALAASPVARRLRLGEALTRGLGAGGDPAVGARAAHESLEELRIALRGADLVFVTAGMGGGTGTGAAPIVARLAHELGALTVAVVSTPFGFEGTRRARQASAGIAELRPHVDTLIVVPNERLLALVDHQQPFTQALRVADDILRQGVRGVSDLITTPGTINLDFADIRAVIAGAGTALMAIGEAEGDRRAVTAARLAVESPLLERDIRGASRIILNLAGGPDLSLLDVNDAAQLVQQLAHPDATIIFGAVQDDTLVGRIRVTLIATGFPAEPPALPSAIGEAEPTPPAAKVTEPEPDPPTTGAAAGQMLAAAWPLPDHDAFSEEPTIALPALSLLRPAEPADVTDDPAETAPRRLRLPETAWTPDQQDGLADVYDIPAFLRRPERS